MHMHVFFVKQRLLIFYFFFCKTIRKHRGKNKNKKHEKISYNAIPVKSENENSSVVSDSLQPHRLSMEFFRPKYWSG